MVFHLTVSRTILLIPDTHVPSQHVRALNNVTAFARDFGPTEILQLGDWIDCTAPARWSKGLAEEYANTLEAEVVEGHDLLARFRQFHDGKFDYIMGNHEARIGNYLAKYAPAFSGMSGLRVENLLRLSDIEVTMQKQPYELTSGWVAIHGDKLAPYAGGSAMKMVKFLGKSVVQGHSHRAGIITETTDKMRTGMECGHLSDQRKADYISYGQANWQMSFGLLHINGSSVHPELIPIASNGSFHYQGKFYDKETV